MSILFSNEILISIENELRLAQESVQFISAYCKLESIRKLSKSIAPSVQDKKIMLRFRLDDLAKHSTDFEVLDFCREQNWEIYIRFDLHAKTYIVDNKRGIVGSANATKRGLAEVGNSNFEMAALVDIEESDLDKIRQLYREAILVDDKILEMLRKQYQKIINSKTGEEVQWGKEILDLFSPHVRSLFSYELPDKSFFEIGEYVAFMDVIFDGNLKEIQEKFRWNNSYLWLINILEQNNGELYFGELSNKLHNALVTDPKPYRKDVKQLLSNMLSLINNWKMKEIIIDRPNYSQRIRLNKY